MATESPASLNTLQAEAVTCDAKRILVLAGAGAGKTKTLLQKIVHLVEEKGVSPSSILAITFTRNAANEMTDRLILAADETGTYERILNGMAKNRSEMDLERNHWQRRFRWIDNLTIRTFHSFCYHVLRNFGVNQFDNKFRIIGEEKQTDDRESYRNIAPETAFEVFHKLLIERCSDHHFLLDLKRYILDYIVDKVHLDQPFHLSSNDQGKRFSTLNGEKVRSKSEQFIADWLFRNNIRYAYEPELKVKDFPFHPDFFIPEANLYIEHVSNISYSMKNKEEQFRKGKLLLVKTYENMTRDSAYFSHVLDDMVRKRLPSGKHRECTLSYKEALNGYYEEVKDFVQQVMRINDMIRVENIDLDKVAEKAGRDQHDRVRSFYRLALPVIEQYHRYCTDKSYLDFNDLIIQTILLFRNNPDIAAKYRKKYRYILVDEFQDVNNLQVELVKLLLTPSAQLFCVGDDWQSIYGFRGSNVNYIIDFEKHFRHAKLIKLNLNYRSHQHIVGASNEVIRHNKLRIDKEVHAAKRSEHKIVVYAGTNSGDNLTFCAETVRALLNDGLTGDDILFLYRRSKMFSPYYDFFREAGIRVQGKTIHASKGLEARVVFILGLTEGSGGFPDIWLEDRIFQVVRKANHDLLLEEERRLFYVAMTRAKDKLYLITEKGNESEFLKEIPEMYTVRTAKPLKPVVEEVGTCLKCFSALERLWVVCPYCGTKVSS